MTAKAVAKILAAGSEPTITPINATLAEWRAEAEKALADLEIELAEAQRDLLTKQAASDVALEAVGAVFERIQMAAGNEPLAGYLSNPLETMRRDAASLRGNVSQAEGLIANLEYRRGDLRTAIIQLSAALSPPKVLLEVVAGGSVVMPEMSDFESIEMPRAVVS